MAIRLVVRQAQDLELDVVDLVKDPNAAGPLTRSTTLKSNLDKAVAQLLALWLWRLAAAKGATTAEAWYLQVLKVGELR